MRMSPMGIAIRLVARFGYGKVNDTARMHRWRSTLESIRSDVCLGVVYLHVDVPGLVLALVRLWPGFVRLRSARPNTSEEWVE